MNKAYESDAPARAVPLGPTGYEVTRVGLGAWAIGGPWQKGWGAQDDRDSVATIEHALASGVNWIDTAAVYGLGHAEAVIGEVLAGLEETDRPWVFTKCGRYEDPGIPGKAGRPDLIRRSCDESLRRLRVDRLDMLQLHWPPEDGTPLEVTWETMAELQREGLVATLGACNCTARQLDVIDAIARVDVVQPPLSMINRDSLSTVIPWAAAKGAGVLVYSPMQSGILTGGFHERAAMLEPDDWRLEDPEFQQPNLDRNLQLVEGLRLVAARLECTIAELVVAWALSRAGVTAAIVGARRPDQVDGWRGADGVVIDLEAEAEIAVVIEASGAGHGPLAMPSDGESDD